MPYCRACIARDARERESLASRWRRRLGGILIRSFPAVFPLGFAVFLLTTIEPPTHPGDATGGFERALALLFGLSGAGLLAYGWWDTRNCMVPKQTSVTVAFDFSPDVSDIFDHAQRRVYAMRDAVFADAFAALNRDRIWRLDPALEVAQPGPVLHQRGLLSELAERAGAESAPLGQLGPDGRSSSCLLHLGHCSVAGRVGCSPRKHGRHGGLGATSSLVTFRDGRARRSRFFGWGAPQDLCSEAGFGAE